MPRSFKYVVILKARRGKRGKPVGNWSFYEEMYRRGSETYRDLHRRALKRVAKLNAGAKQRVYRKRTIQM